MKKSTLVYPILLLVFLSTSCVSKKKFTESEDKYSSLLKRYRELREDNRSLKSRLTLMEEANEATESELSVQSEVLTQKQQQLKDREARISLLESKLKAQKENTERLRSKMANALKSFDSDELSVFSKNGKVYVSLSEKLLFPSGSADVNEEGVAALEQVSKALKENKDINLTIEGHTDSIPIKYKFVDNWALSVARATAIVRLLTDRFGMSPQRVLASGRSQYMPIADNATPEGRAKNRRTEIILEPNLTNLLNLLDVE